MKMNFSDLIRSKTFWAALGTVVTAVGGGLTGQISWISAGTSVLTALMGLGIRDAVHQG